MFCLLLITQWLLPAPATYNVIDFGAVPDGQTLNTAAIQRAVDSCAGKGGGRVLFPPGRYLSGSICLKSGVELYLSAEATLLGSTRRIDYDKNNWYALLLAHSQRNIAVRGAGTIDGQGTALAADVDRLYREGIIKDAYRDNRVHESQRPQLIDFEQCQNINIEGITLKNAACWVQRYGACDSLRIEHIRVESRAFWNNDGIDLVDCTNTLVRHCDIDVADDGICLKSDRRERACNRIRIEHCRIRSSASALKFGTNSYGGFKNITISELDIYDTYRSAIALEIVDGGTLENILVQHIRARNTGNALFMRLGHRNQRVAPGQFRGVRIRDVEVQVPAGKPDAGMALEGPLPKDKQNIAPIVLAGLPDHPLEDIRIENIAVEYPGGGNPDVAWRPLDSLARIPERPKDYPEFSMFGELPAWGLYARHISTLQLKNIRFQASLPDYRPVIVLDGVDGVSGKKWSARSWSQPERIVLRKVRIIHLHLKGLQKILLE